MIRVSVVTVLCAMLALTPAFAAAGTEAPLGTWLTGKRKVAVDFYQCGERLCGRIVWLAKPRWSEGTLKRDERNPDPALRDRLWCGIEAVTGLRPDGPGRWKKGLFYNPKDGNSYDLDLRAGPDGTLKARAYFGLRLFGKSETWVRPEGPLPGCVPDTEADAGAGTGG